MADKNFAAVSAISLHEAAASSESQSAESKSDFTNVNLATEDKPKRLVLKDPSAPDYENKKNKVPRRTIHFSDGVLEEFSETEDEEDEVDNTPPVNPKTLKWMPWFLHYFSKSARGSLRVADICGEKLAWLLGITSPKYQYAIEEYKRLKKQEEEEKEREEREKEFQRQRKLQGSGIDVEGGIPTYSNKAFGLEVREGGAGGGGGGDANSCDYVETRVLTDDSVNTAANDASKADQKL